MSRYCGTKVILCVAAVVSLGIAYLSLSLDFDAFYRWKQSTDPSSLKFDHSEISHDTFDTTVFKSLAGEEEVSIVHNANHKDPSPDPNIGARPPLSGVSNVGNSNWGTSSIHFGNSKTCDGDVYCLESLAGCPILENVRYQNGILELFGLRNSTPGYEEIPQYVEYLEKALPIKSLKAEHTLNVQNDCDVVLDDTPVFVNYPTHTSNFFHVHNDNIFKLLITADMVGLLNSLDKIALLHLPNDGGGWKAKILQQFYDLFGSQLDFEDMAASKRRVCVKRLIFSFTAYEIFNFWEGHRVSEPLPSSPYSVKMVRAMRNIFWSKFYPSEPYDYVDRQLISGKLVVFLGRSGGDVRRSVLPKDRDRLATEFLRRGARFVVVATDVEYQNQMYMWELLRNASMIIGPHGAALTNALYAPPGTLVVELRTAYASSTKYFENICLFNEQDHLNVAFAEYNGGERNITDQELTKFVQHVVDIYELKEPVSSYTAAHMMPLFLSVQPQYSTHSRNLLNERMNVDSASP